MFNNVNNLMTLYLSDVESEPLKELLSTCSKIAFKYGIIDSTRTAALATFADTCVNYTCEGGNISEAVEALYAKGYITSKRDNDIFYRECVNRLIYTGSKLNKYALFHNLEELKELNDINVVLIRAQKAIEENLPEELKVSVSPFFDYSYVSVCFEDDTGSVGKFFPIEDVKTPLQLLQLIYDHAASFFNGYGFNEKYQLKLGEYLDAELVHQIFIDADRMSSSDKLQTIKDIFKNATPGVKERLCNLYLGDYNTELRQFLQEQTVKMAKEKNITEKPSILLTKKKNIEI